MDSTIGFDTVFIVFGRWNPGGSEHIIGVFNNEVDAKKEAADAEVADVSPRFETWIREFGVK